MDIRKVLSEKGISYQELADRINSKRSDTDRKATTASISQMVNGEPSLKSLREIADAVGCKAGDFFTDETTPKEDALTALVKSGDDCYSATTTDELREIADTIDKLHSL